MFSAGTATKLVYTAQPAGGTGGTAWTTQPVVAVEDANGNTVTGSSAPILVAIGTNPSAGTLTCKTNPQNATAGIDTFAGCEINKTGNGYTLTATSSGLTSATSNPFNITSGPRSAIGLHVAAECRDRRRKRIRNPAGSNGTRCGWQYRNDQLGFDHAGDHERYRSNWGRVDLHG